MLGSILLRGFNSNQPVSLDELAMVTGLSIEEVDKTCNWLIGIGVPLNRPSADTAQLTKPVLPLNLEQIQQAVSTFDIDLANKVQLFEEINSTNQYLMSLPLGQLQHKQVCIAEYMTAGRGRQQKKWYGGAYENLMLSIAWEFHSEVHLSGLSLAVAVMVVNCVQQICGAPFRLKWPNDVLVDEHKLSGILIEVRDTKVIVGIGINCNLSFSDQLEIDQPATSLFSLLGHQVDRSELTAVLLGELSDGLELFSIDGLDAFREDWMRRHAYQGRRMRVVGKPLREGRAVGIDQSGALLIRTENGRIVPINSGELQVLPV